MSVKLKDLANMPEGEQNEALTDLVRAAKAPRNGQAQVLDRRIREFEVRYEMSTDEMLDHFARGDIKDTADIAEWSILARARRGR